MDKEEFLNLIRQIESSGGKNTNHKQMKSGIHKGDSAMGEYGIMPNTAREFIKRRQLKDQIGPDEALMQQMNSSELKDFLANQDRVEQNLAEDIADRVLKRSKGDEEKAAYMWNQGHNLKASQVDDEMLDSANYVNKFRALRSLMGNKRKLASEE